MPYKSKTFEGVRKDHRIPSRLTSDNFIWRPKPLLNLKHVSSKGDLKSQRMKNSNVFGYTPYDTGAVKSDFTSMIESIPKQSSLLNSQIKQKAPETLDVEFGTEGSDKQLMNLKVSSFRLKN